MSTPRLVAVIDIGSTAIRMVVAEIAGPTSWRIIDRSGKPVPLGRDAFKSGAISRETITQSLKILSGFRELLDGYGIHENDITVIGTSALREARNRDAFVDRVAIKTSFQTSIVEGIEENKLTYMAVQDALKDLRGEMERANSIIIEVGGGSTELMLLRQGSMVAAHSLNLGTVRVEQQLQTTHSSTDQLPHFLRESIRNVCDVLSNEFALDTVDYFIAVGGDARIAAEKTHSEVFGAYSVIKKDVFERFVSDIEDLTVDECVTKLQIPYDQADTLVTALLMYRQFLEGTRAERLVVPQTSIREGVLLNLASGPDEQIQEEFASQILASAVSIGRKYHFDEEHALHVARLALSLFDQLHDEHGLDTHSRILLHVAAVLHDIGTYVKASGHHKHGQYLVSNSEIFGLHADDVQVVSNVVRYHRRSMPVNAHVSYMSLPRADRIRVLKLAAILRVADALDRAHAQRIRSIDVAKHGEEILVRTPYHGDISIEKYGLATKGSMFEEVFGMRVVLVGGQTKEH